MYDHHNKAGNPGDVIKHVALIAAADVLMQDKHFFRYADTFAGYAYNPIRSTGEWEHGIGLFNDLADYSTDDTINFWRSLWSCEFGLPGSVYPGSSTFIRKLCIKHGIQPQLSLWDTSAAVIAQLKQVYSDKEANIFSRPATIEDIVTIEPDFQLIDPPDLRLVDSLIEFFKKSESVILWLPILADGNIETDESKCALKICKANNLGVLSVDWGGETKMRGCRIVYSIQSANAVDAMKTAVTTTVRIGNWRFSEQ